MGQFDGRARGLHDGCGLRDDLFADPVAGD
jgi:hypothetical protein